MAKRTGPDAAGPVPTGWYRSRSVRSSPCFDETSRQLTLGRCVTLSSSRACPRTGGTLSGAPSTSETGLSANSNFMILSSRTTGCETCARCPSSAALHVDFAHQMRWLLADELALP